VSSPRHPLLDVILLFTRLGFTAFGGPAAHVALIERECVRRRAWLTREQFLDLLGIANLIPGPTSTELAMHVGYHRAGWIGLAAAGVAFIAPAALIVGLLAALYVKGADVTVVRAVMQAVQPVVLVVVLDAILPLARIALRTPQMMVIGVASLAAVAAGLPAIAVLLLAGLASLVTHRAALATILVTFGTAVIVAAQPISVPGAGGWEVFGYFARTGSLLFGSGYVLLPVLEHDLVQQRAWLTGRQLVDAIAVGQATPGPVFTTATFVGYLLGGVPFAAVATVGMFLPAFVCSALSAPYVQRLRAFAPAQRFLAGVNAAAVALIGWVLITLGRDVLVAPLPLVILAVAAVLVFLFRINPGFVLAGAASAGVLLNVLSR
jgi:chromate transporter